MTTTPITLNQAAAAAHRATRAQAELSAALRIQNQWAEENGGQYVEATGRIPFPVDTFDGSCPECGKEGTIQSVCLAPHVWDDARMEDGQLSFEGGFDWLDDSIDPHIACWECDAEWAEPAKVDYR